VLLERYVRKESLVIDCADERAVLVPKVAQESHVVAQVAHTAEIVQSGLSQWQAVSRSISVYPGFGSLLTVPLATGVIVGLVSDIVVAAADDLYLPIPLGLERSELDRLHPQSSLHTRVTLTCLMLGYAESVGAKFSYQWPTHPPSLHALVYEATEEWYERCFATEQYLPILLHNPAVSACRDELLLALITQRHQRGLLNELQLQQFVSAIAPFFIADYSRFRQFLQRLEKL